MISLHFLGTASGIPTFYRFNSATLLCCDQDKYLIDCGEPVSSLLLRTGFDWKEIKAVFISHMHADHFSGIFQLLQSLQIAGRTEKLSIMMPENAINTFKSFLELILLHGDMLPYQLEIIPVQSGYIFKDDNFQVTACPTNHLKPYNRPAYSYSFEGDIKIVYSGDIGSINDLRWLQEADVLIMELAHVPLDDVLQFLKIKSKIGKIVLSHIHPDLEGKEKEVFNMLLDFLPKERITIAGDGTMLKIVPEKCYNNEYGL